MFSLKANKGAKCVDRGTSFTPNLIIDIFLVVDSSLKNHLSLLQDLSCQQAFYLEITDSKGSRSEC